MLNQIQSKQQKEDVFDSLIYDMSELDKQISELNKAQPFNRVIPDQENLLSFQMEVDKISNENKCTLAQIQSEKQKIVKDLRVLVPIYDQYLFNVFQIKCFSHQNNKLGVLLSLKDSISTYLLLITFEERSKKEENMFLVLMPYTMIKLENDSIYLGSSTNIDQYNLKDSKLILKHKIVISSEIESFCVGQQYLIYASSDGLFLHFVMLENQTKIQILRILPRNATEINLFCYPTINPEFVYLVSRKNLAMVQVIDLNTLKYTTQNVIPQEDLDKMLNQDTVWTDNNLTYELKNDCKILIK